MLASLRRGSKNRNLSAFGNGKSTRYLPLATVKTDSLEAEIVSNDSLTPLPNMSLIPYAEQVHDAVVQISKNIHYNFGPNCSESLYQRAVLRATYLKNLPAMLEREVFTDYGQGSLLVGRIDLEVASCCLYEFKSSKINIAEHSLQLQRYLRAYDNNNETIRVAALLYFTQTGIFVHRVR
jgi:hypothetical protein